MAFENKMLHQDEQQRPAPPPAGTTAANAPDNSASHRDTPAGIVADATLSRSQKLEMLHAWQNDLTGRNACQQDVILLRLVMAAISDVERQGQ